MGMRMRWYRRWASLSAIELPSPARASGKRGNKVRGNIHAITARGSCAGGAGHSAAGTGVPSQR